MIFLSKAHIYNGPLHERIRRNKFSIKRHPEQRGVTWFDYLHVLFQEPYSHISFKLVICALVHRYPQVTAHQCMLNHTWSPCLTCVGGYINKAEPIFSPSCLCFPKAVESILSLLDSCYCLIIPILISRHITPHSPPLYPLVLTAC